MIRSAVGLGPQVSRRQVLAALAAFGAALSVPPLHATQLQLNAEWARLVDDPFLFEVDDHGTIADPGGEQMPTRTEIYGIHIDESSTVGDVVDAAQNAYGLRVMLDRWATSQVDNMRAQAANPTCTRERSRRLLQMADDAIEWGEGVGVDWLTDQGEMLAPLVLPVVAEWLGQDATDSDVEWAGPRSGVCGRALTFFEGLDDELLRALGVVFIEGEHPGSSYFAAELRSGVESANATAVRLALPFRFVQR